MPRGFDSPQAAIDELRSRWRLIVFYVGFALSPLTPGNDAVVNQLPSSLLAAALAGGSDGSSYTGFYVGFYILSNVLGVLLMLVNLPELRRRFRRLRHEFRHSRAKFFRTIALDIATLILMWVVGYAVLRLVL